MTTPRNRTHLAELLGIAKSAVTAQAARGMPTDSLAAAQAWRKANLDPSRKKGSRLDRYYQPAHPATPPPPAQPPAPELDWFTLAGSALNLADLLLDNGQSIDALIPSLRGALAAVPKHERHALELPEAVLRVLLRDVLALLPDDDTLTETGTTFYDKSMSDTDAEEVGQFWYEVAAGEWKFDLDALANTDWTTP